MKAKKGFTLIELLIVITIIGILAAALLPTVLNAPARGRDSARIGNMNSIVAALEAYNSDFGSYPKSSGCIGTGEVFDDDPSATVGTSVLPLYFSGGTPPKDPSGDRTDITAAGTCPASGQYYYRYIGTVGVAEYIIGTVMELQQNNNTGVDITSADPDFSCTGAACTTYVLVK